MKKVIVLSVIGVALVFFWLKIIDLDAMLVHFNDIDYRYLILTFILIISGLLLRAIRWFFIVKRIIRPIKLGDSIINYFLGAFVDFLIPIRIGEIVKCYNIKDKYSVPISSTISTIFLDRVMDIFPIIFILIFIPFVNFKLTGYLLYLIIFLIVILVTALVIIYLVIKYPDKIEIRLEKITLKFKFKHKIIYFIRNFMHSIKIIQPDVKLLLIILTFSVLAIFSNCFAFWFVLKAFGDQQILIHVALFGYSLLFLSYIVPAPPAQIGSNEVVFLLIFNGIFGFNKNYISAIIIFFHSFVVLIMLLIGIILIKYFHKNIKKYIYK